jgi:hypothetical protein
MYQIATNIAQVMANVKKIERQIPFAQSKAINDTAFKVRQQIVRHTYPDAFEVKNPRFISAVLRVEKSTKTKLEARVFDRLGRDYLQRQAIGGTKLPRGNSIAVPGVQNTARTAGGAIRKSDRPRNVLTRKDTFKTDKGIFQRRGKQPIKMLYLLTPDANIPKRFPFYEDARRIVNDHFNANYRKALQQAMRTAR